MSEPIFLISHFRVREGKSHGMKQFFREGTKLLQEEKPHTLVFVSYLGEDGTQLTIVHVFADTDSMDLHVKGAEERTTAANEFVEPRGFEIYGMPTDRDLEMFRGAATSEAQVSFQTQHVCGFLRLRRARRGLGIGQDKLTNSTYPWGVCSRTRFRFAANSRLRFVAMSRIIGSISFIHPELLIWTRRVNVVAPSAGSNR